MWRALMQFELRQQAREPLTTLYALIFFLLAFGHASSGAVELVADRGGAAKTAPWAIALAFGGLTAFGQVITTMVAATALLRDLALGSMPLLATKALSPRTWFTARLAATFAVLAIVYAAMPAGLLLGAAVANVAHGRALGPAGLPVAAIVRAYVVITVPTCVAVAAILGATAALTQRTLAVLAVALCVVGLWQLALALEAQDATRTLGALLDPFANAPLLAISRDWLVSDRQTRTVPFAGVLLWNRVLWVSLGAAVSALSMAVVRWPSATHLEIQPPATSAPSRGDATTTTPFASLLRFTAAWMLRDGGWRVVTLLAVANATLNAWARAAQRNTVVGTLLLVSEHARLFLVLLATVYAGEVLWRERDVRVDALCDSSPVSTRTMAAGRLAGLFAAQLPVVLLLGTSAALMVVWRQFMHADGSPLDVARLAAAFPAWFVFVLWLPFAQLTALSVAVHAMVRHKVAAHLVIITGWVLAVVLNRHGADGWWYRFAEPGEVQGVDGVAWRGLLQHAAWWSAISAALLIFSAHRWPRGKS